MHIRMLERRWGSPDGQILRLYEQGECYYLPTHLGHYFVMRGYACRLITHSIFQGE